MIEWRNIETVLLDMDGTLLDLHFDNFFWRHHLPLRYAEIKGLAPAEAKDQICDQTRRIEGSLNWYSTDYWSETLEIDIVQLKHEVSHKVALRPYCIDFLDALRVAGKHVVMVTNAHQDSLSLKMDRTNIAEKFDRLITVHEFSLPKENPLRWDEVHKRYPFCAENTLLIDDNLHVLASAREYGIGALLAIYQPDSRLPRRQIDDFDAIHCFDEIMPVAELEA